MKSLDDRRLYVGNLPEDVGAKSLEAFFAEYGRVRDVYMATDRASGHSLRYAFVTMESAAEAEIAIQRRSGAPFQGSVLRVTLASERNEAPRETASSPKAKVRVSVVVTMQFREARNMAYELDCSGTKLVVRVFPVDESEKAWRIEASVRGASVAVSSGPHATRLLALEEVVRSWPAAQPIDWPAVTEALAGVRAV